MKLIGILPLPTATLSFGIPVYQDVSNGFYYYHNLTRTTDEYRIEDFIQAFEEKPEELILLPKFSQREIFKMDPAIFAITSSCLFFVGTRQDFLSRYEFFQKEGGANFKKEFNELII